MISAGVAIMGLYGGSSPGFNVAGICSIDKVCIFYALTFIIIMLKSRFGLALICSFRTSFFSTFLWVQIALSESSIRCYYTLLAATLRGVFQRH